MLRKSRTNWCRLPVQLTAQNLFVDGCRATAGAPAGDSVGWRNWTANRMARRQAAVHRATLKYGTAFVSVLPGDPSRVIKGHSPQGMSAFYADPDDEWPVYALQKSRLFSPSGPQMLYRIYDDQAVYFLAPDRDGALSYVEHRDHGAGVTPVVRFVDEDDLGGARPGVVAPVIDIQDRVNFRTFLLMAASQSRASTALGVRARTGRRRGTAHWAGPAVALRQPGNEVRDVRRKPTEWLRRSARTGVAAPGGDHPDPASHAARVADQSGGRRARRRRGRATAPSR